MTNRLALETSPYLQQHKDNPVDWRPWNQEALELARTEDKPILLSIGYSACHWCHVMAHESFEDEDTAKLMNSLFVCIKVDREERPDLDDIYMGAVQSLNGQGGWPLTVFLTPDGKPFYGGTYFPPEDRHGLPAFRRVLMAVAGAYREEREGVLRGADELVSRLAQVRPQRTEGAAGDGLTEDLLRGAIQALKASFDSVNGGFGAAPKFPQPMGLELLLRSHLRFGDPEALRMVETSLDRMARGGMYDQVGGGFHRYSTDAEWLVPHFEKMLYDNAQLSRTYLHAFQLTGNPFYRRIAQETLDYVLREMTSPEGGFYSAQDADSEGVEGRFYVWSLEEMVDALGDSNATVLASFFGASEAGNFEGKNILHALVAPAQVAQRLGMSEQDLMATVEDGRKRLYEARERRTRPGRDEKALAAWNGLMLRSLAEAAATLNRGDYLAAAVANGTFLVERLLKDSRLLRSSKDGQARLLGYLEDYASVTNGLVSLYEATFDGRWLRTAQALADAMIDLFWEDSEEAFYDTGKDHESLVVRPRNTFDNAIPCGGSVAAEALLRLAAMLGNSRYEEYSRGALANIRSTAATMRRYPLGFGQWLQALDFHLSAPREIAIVGTAGDPRRQELRRAVFGPFLPNKVVAGWDPDSGSESRADIPLLRERPMLDGKPTVYVCERYVCRLPVTDAHVLAEQLRVP